MNHAAPILPMHNDTPDSQVSTKDLFGVAVNFKVQGFAKSPDGLAAHVPAREEAYFFEPETTRALLAGFAHNRRVMIQGYHGTGKSTHIEQIAARLNWPCVRINLDSHISRTDLVGRDMITLKDGKQVTEFHEGILPWAIARPVALVLDEYDAGRPDVMFVIQRVLEARGKFTLLDQSRIITPHPYFRMFATSNTVGLGDSTGLYHGTQPINQGQMDRWNMVASLNYLAPEDELKVINAKVEKLKGKDTAQSMIAMANLTREGFMQGDLSIVMSPRTIIHWAENTQILDDVHAAFRLTFFNKCDEHERPIIAEYYQRCFNFSLLEPA